MKADAIGQRADRVTTPALAELGRAVQPLHAQGRPGPGPGVAAAGSRRDENQGTRVDLLDSRGDLRRKLRVVAGLVFPVREVTFRLVVQLPGADAVLSSPALGDAERAAGRVTLGPVSRRTPPRPPCLPERTCPARGARPSRVGRSRCPRPPGPASGCSAGVSARR